MARLFGTDGIRGIANEELTIELAMKTGRAAAAILAEESGRKPLILIGKDTRISSDMLESALAAGICSAGGDVVLLGTLPTPAVAYLTVQLGADAGIMISASHNPYEYNGIKIFGSEGFKLTDEVEDSIERRVKEGINVKSGSGVGVIKYAGREVKLYTDYIASLGDDIISGTKVLIDCANGAAAYTACDIFEPFGPDIDFIGNASNGININDGCGSTCLDMLSKKVVEGGYDIGIAFDGDADRCLAVDEKGDIIDGDRIMAICAADMKEKNRLRGNTIVATVMSNLGFHMYAEENGINVICAQVGDRYVLEEMLKNGYTLGGEQSGHLIFLEDATTGDGQLSAVKLLNILAGSGLKASELNGRVKQYPQVLKNVRVTTETKHRLADDPSVCEATRKAEEMVSPRGRVLVRASGTEALVRVMVEGLDEAVVNRACDLVVDEIEKLI